MNALHVARKVVRGFPYLAKEIRSQVSNHSPLFIARPRMVYLWRHAPCNARCIMCDFGFRKGEAWKALFTSPLKEATIPRLLDEIHELGGRGTMVSYMGGEPMLSRPLMDWLDQCKKLNLDFRFTTNGYDIDEEAARRLVAADLFNIGVSIESLDPAINEVIRPYRNGTALAIQAIELLLAEKRRQRARISINIKVTLTQLNIESVLDIVQRWGKTDGILVSPQMFEVIDGTPDEVTQRLWIKDIGRIQAVVSELKKLKAAGYNIYADDQALDDFVEIYRKDPDHKSTLHNRTVVAEDRPPCYIGTDQLYIIDGAVHLCPPFAPIGSVLDGNTTLKELWFSDKARRTRAAMRKCRVICTLSCMRQTSFWHKVRAFLKM